MSAEAALGERIAALGRAVELGRRHLPETSLQPAADVVDRAGERLRHGTAHTVVALAGPTGSGKSSLFNALVGTEVSKVGVRRPTTGETHAAAWGTGAGPLLDWLGVGRRHVVTGAGAALDGLVLLDLPDHDSTAVDHRLEVARLLPLVDLLIWVVEPQKYADQALHDDELRPLAGFGSVMRFVLTKVDLLDDAEAAACAADLRARLGGDGIVDAQVGCVSVATGEGLGAVVGLLEDEVTARRAVIEHLELEVERVAAPLVAGAGGEGTVPADARRDLVRSLSRAGGVDAVAAASARQYRRDATAAVGWPPVRWLARFRRSPLAGLADVERSPVAATGVGSALRRLGEAVGDHLEPPWDEIVRADAMGRRPAVLTGLADVSAAGLARSRPPRWWSGGRWVQRLLGVVALAGLAWLVALAVVESLLRLEVGALAPEVAGIPLPTALLLGGVVAGLVVAGLGRLLARAGGRRRARAVARRLRDEVARVADERVISPIEHLLGDRRDLLVAARRALGDGPG